MLNGATYCTKKSSVQGVQFNYVNCKAITIESLVGDTANYAYVIDPRTRY